MKSSQTKGRTSPKRVESSVENSFQAPSQGTGSKPVDFGLDFFEQMLGKQEIARQKEAANRRADVKVGSAQREFGTIWSIQQEKETRTIRELLVTVQSEIKNLKKADATLAQEVKGIEQLTIEMSQTEDVSGIYNVRFLELMVALLKTIRLKITESGTWLSSFHGKAKKRGFKALTKKKGTSYSMSQELQMARATG